MSPRWFDKRTGDHLALDTGGGPLARLWATALAGKVDIGYVKATGKSVKINLPKTALQWPETEFEWKIPQWSNTIERDRARTYFQAYAAAAALHFVEKALEEVHAGRTKTWTEFKVPDEAIGCGFHEAVRGVLSHHMVIRDGKIANYHPYPPTPWNASPRDSYGTPGPYEDAVQGHADLRGERPGELQGHRHHAHGAQFRPVPALRRAHVPGGGQDAGQSCTRQPSRPPGSDLWPIAQKYHDSQWRTAGDRIQTLLDSCAAGGAAAHERAEQLVREVVGLYGAGLERIVALLGDPRLAEQLATDDLVASLLLVHGLHPHDLHRRVSDALDRVRPYLGSHGGDVDLLEVTDDEGATVRLPVRRQLQELSVVSGDTGVGRRGCGPGGCAGGLVN